MSLIGGINRAACKAQLRVDRCEGLRPVHSVDVDLLKRAGHRYVSERR